MRISATGVDRRRDRGFTLVEVMVTLLLVGLITGVALLTLPSGGAHLAREAEQLGARIKQAQREAMLSNRAVELVVERDGSHFRVRRTGRWQMLADGPFRRRPWRQGVTVALQGPGGVRFDPSGATDPAIIRLSAGERAMELTVDAQGAVRIHER
jgi:general secretion pathway protein H